MIANYLKDLRGEGINLVDIGSSGSLDEKWNPLKELINLIGFDPNEVECSRQNLLPSKYKSSKFLPYAVHGHSGVETLYMTKSIYCYSLLRPNKSWLDRFSFRDLFDLSGEEDIRVHDISEIDELKKVRPDVIKIDVQGLELPILSKAVDLLDSAFYVETETGFTQNYIGETTFSQLDGFMQARGFLMFDINTNHRIPRDNYFKNHPSGKEQVLWAEAVWLKDYIELDRRGLFDISKFNEKKIRKILILCSLQGCYDFGLELAEFFYAKGLLSKKELDCLKSIDAWQFESHLSNPTQDQIRIDHKNTSNLFSKIIKAVNKVIRIN
ncbi:FkbM family methyltransferase [Polynucleobacter paneuropaeus]|nr:FkbM family methyltransferase [Polynucleobacter paneuropaeus]